jgi:hypothetical protein
MSDLLGIPGALLSFLCITLHSLGREKSLRQVSPLDKYTDIMVFQFVNCSAV